MGGGSVSVTIAHSLVGRLVFSVDRGGVIIGRGGHDANIVLYWDTGVSRRHARMWVDAGRLFVEDLGSRNGVWVDGIRQTRAEVDSRTSVSIGSTYFYLEQSPSTGSEFDGETDELVLPPPIPEPPQVSDIPQTTDISRVRLTTDVAMKPPRGAPRFLAAQQVILRVNNREDLEPVWTRDISNGGLFVETDAPPAQGEHVSVDIQTPTGTMSLKAEVVHVVDTYAAEKSRQKAGVGLQFLDLTPDASQAIKRYVDGIADGIASRFCKRGPSKEAQENSEMAVRRAGLFFRSTETGDYYHALGLAPDVPLTQLRNESQRLRTLFARGQEAATPPQKVRLQSAQNVLTRIESVFADEERRAAYDFRVGHVRARERLSTGSHLTAQQLRGIWSHTNPERVRHGQRLAERAFTAHQKGDTDSAIDLGQEALEHDPFHLDLRRSVTMWRSLAAAPAEDDDIITSQVPGFGRTFRKAKSRR